MTGRILRGVGGYYTVSDGTKEYFCIARGRFRKEGQRPLVGDLVEFSPPGREEEFGAVVQILPRMSELTRPPIANIDLLLVTVAAAVPQPDLMLADRLLARARLESLACVLVVNKCDLDAPAGERIAAQYLSGGLPVLQVSALLGQGLGELGEAMRGHVVCLAGQSGVGKSSLLNAMLPGVGLETGDVSRIERGRHTTRHATLLPLPGGGFVADTPGFSLLELDTRPPETLKEAYPEFRPLEPLCRFEGCMHCKEPGCAVRAAADRGELSPERLGRYALLVEELREKWARRFR